MFTASLRAGLRGDGHTRHVGGRLMIVRIASTAVCTALLLLACDGPADQCADGVAQTSSIASAGGTFVVTSYVLPHPVVVHDAAVDSAGRVWYAAQSTGCIGTLDPGTGAFHERSAVRSRANLHGLAWDAALQGVWHGADAGFLTLSRPDGGAHRVPLPDNGRVHSVAVVDHVVWFTTGNGSGFHDTRSGRTETHPSPAEPYDLAAGPDGAVWFSMTGGAAIGRYPPGALEPPDIMRMAPGAEPLRLAVDATGTAWFTDWRNARIGAWTPAADSARWFVLPDGMAFPRAIAAAPDGRIWYYAESAGAIIRLNPEDGRTDQASIPVIGRHLTFDRRRGVLWVSGGSGLAAIEVP